MLGNSTNLEEKALGSVLEQELGLEGDDGHMDNDGSGEMSMATGRHVSMKGRRGGEEGEATPARLSRSSSAAAVMDSSVASSAKRRGRPRGWTDARIHSMLTYLERNMGEWKSGNLVEFYSNLCAYLGLDQSEALDIHEKCEKMIKKYESDRRRGDGSWKWFARLNQVFDGPALPAYQTGHIGGMHLADDDAASSSLDSCDEEGADDGLLDSGEAGLVKKARGEDPFHDHLVHEKLLIKLKRLKSKTEMRHNEIESSIQQQMMSFEELKAKTSMAIARLEKSIINAGYLLDQAELMTEEQAAAEL